MMGVYTHVFWDEKSIASNKKWLRSKQVPLLATFSHSLSQACKKRVSALAKSILLTGTFAWQACQAKIEKN